MPARPQLTGERSQELTDITELRNSNSACSTMYGAGDDSLGATSPTAAALRCAVHLGVEG
jgi:hypothetical protein